MHLENSVKLELNVSASRLIQQLIIQNEELENQFEKGVNKAISNLFEGDNLSNFVADSVHKEINGLLHQAIYSWDLKQKIKESITSKIEQQMTSYCDKIGEKVSDILKNKIF